MRSVDEKISELIIKLEAEYTKKTMRSRELYEKSTRYMPAGVTYALRYMSPYPLYIERARGTRLSDTRVKADVVVFGKAISGGVSSAGAVASRAEIMELMDHLKRPDPSTRVFHGGTYVASVLSVVVGYAVAKYLIENKYLYDEANRLWSEFRRRVQRACEESSVQCWTTGTGSLSGLHFTAKRPRSARDAYEARWSRVVERALHLYSRVHGAVHE